MAVLQLVTQVLKENCDPDTICSLKAQQVCYGLQSQAALFESLGPKVICRSCTWWVIGIYVLDLAKEIKKTITKHPEPVPYYMYNLSWDQF